MKRFYAGNVIKTKNGSIEIVYDVQSDGYTRTISIDAQNSTCGHQDKTYQKEEYCDCGMSDCEDCNEHKKYISVFYGMEDAELVAYTVKEWITKSLLKNFQF